MTYEGYVDSDFNVSGEITIENTGTLDAVITNGNDVLGGTPITVDGGVGFPYTLPVGETLTCTYSEDGYIEGFKEVAVTTERDEYFADAEIVWGDPNKKINKTVNIEDISGLFGGVDRARSPLRMAIPSPTTTTSPGRITERARRMGLPTATPPRSWRRGNTRKPPSRSTSRALRV